MVTASVEGAGKKNDELIIFKDIDFDKVQIKVATVDAESVILL